RRVGSRGIFVCSTTFNPNVAGARSYMRARIQRRLSSMGRKPSSKARTATSVIGLSLTAFPYTSPAICRLHFSASRPSLSCLPCSRFLSFLFLIDTILFYILFFFAFSIEELLIVVYARKIRKKSKKLERLDFPLFHMLHSLLGQKDLHFEVCQEL